MDRPRSREQLVVFNVLQHQILCYVPHIVRYNVDRQIVVGSSQLIAQVLFAGGRVATAGSVVVLYVRYLQLVLHLDRATRVFWRVK